ncbi:hypothetical protein GCM10018780_81980 [Streptomyces lanatus]|nr:hypothetical protein GCM10018780_81980 [Streptomyces lanatus]
MIWTSGRMRPGPDQPPVHGDGDVAACGIHATGEAAGIEPAGLGRSLGALLSVAGTLDDAAADTG